jgi:chromosome segregation ATPase
MEAVMRTLASIEGAGNVSTNKLGSLVGTDADFIREIAGEYAKKSSDMDLNEAQLQQYFGAELHKRQVDSRQKQIEREKEKIGELREQYQDLDAKMKQLQEEHARRSALNKRIQQEIDKMQALETEENAEVLKTLRSLVALNESLKKQEQDFRQTCKKQLQELQGMIHALKHQSPDDDEVKRLQLVDETYQSDKAKLQEIRQLAAKKNREIAMVQRKIDEIPSRTELQQYQRQFVELYEQVSSKFTETRKYYNSYNTLNDTRQFLQKEASILLSIDENYKTAVSSKQNKERLVESLKGIIEGVNKNVTKVEAKLADEKQRKDLLDADYKSALEKERDYYKMTKEFLDECDKNRQLTARLDA